MNFLMSPRPAQLDAEDIPFARAIAHPHTERIWGIVHEQKLDAIEKTFLQKLSEELDRRFAQWLARMEERVRLFEVVQAETMNMLAQNHQTILRNVDTIQQYARMGLKMWCFWQKT